MSVPSPIPPNGPSVNGPSVNGPSPSGQLTSSTAQPVADPILRGWYLDKPATLRVSEPFLVVQADNAEVVFPRREFRFEVIGPSPTRTGTQQLMFIGDAMNVIFETPFDGGWERFIESVPPELVVTPEAAQLEAAGLTPPSPIGLRIGELDIEPSSPPPPAGPMLARADGTPITVDAIADAATIPADTISVPTAETESDVPRIVVAAESSDHVENTDTAPDELAEPEAAQPTATESAADDLIDSIVRRDLELSDLDLEADADALVADESPSFDEPLFDEPLFDEIAIADERDPAELDGLLDIDTDSSDVDGAVATARRPNRLFGEAANEPWHAEVAPVVQRMVGVAIPIVRVVAPVAIVSRAVAGLRDGATVLDRLFDVALALGVAALVVISLGALLALVRPVDDGYSMFTSLDDRLTRSARRVGVAAAFVAGLTALMVVLDRWLEPGMTWARAGWTAVGLASALAVSAACTVRAMEMRAKDETPDWSMDQREMEEAR